MGVKASMFPMFIVDFCHNIPEPWRSLKHNVYENNPKNGKRDHSIHDCQQNQVDERFCFNAHKQKSPFVVQEGGAVSKKAAPGKA
jgi:hypothetical protein